MARFSKLAATGLATTVLGLIVAACQPQDMAPPTQDSTAPAAVMTVAEVRELVGGNTVIGVDNKRSVNSAEFFSLDGAAKLRAKTLFGTFNYDGTYFFDDLDQFCTNYPGIPLGPKEFCKYVTPLGDGRYEQSDGIILEQILDGEQLGALD